MMRLSLIILLLAAVAVAPVAVAADPEMPDVELVK